eukprot:SM000387S14686  [mRNA]  locus=s387:33384:34545:+ [translate_table: standard]
MAAAACVPPAPYAATALGCGCSQVWCAARRPCALSFFVQPEESCGNSEVADCAARCCNNECAAQEGVASGGDDDEPAVCSRSRAEGPPSPGTASSTGRLPGRTWLAGSEQRWEDDGGGGCSSGGGGSGSSEGGDEEHDSLDGFFAAAEDSRGARKEQVWRSVRELRELVPGAAHVRGLGAVLEHVIAYMQALEARTLAMRRLAVHHRHCRRATAAALKLRSYQGPHPYGHPAMAAATAAAMAVAAGAVEIGGLGLTPPLITATFADDTAATSEATCAALYSLPNKLMGSQDRDMLCRIQNMDATPSELNLVALDSQAAFWLCQHFARHSNLHKSPNPRPS